MLDPEVAASFAGQALAGIGREYPNKLDHIIMEAGDMATPREQHPAFYGCFDWHSAVHSHWMLVRLLRVMPGIAGAGRIRAALGEHLTAANLAAEQAYIDQPGRKSFERTYGWAWLLKLAEELYLWDDPDGREWSRNLQPLAASFVGLYLDFLPKQTYPIRSGNHPNTAFGLAFALDYARTVGHDELAKLIVARSEAYFLADAGAPAGWEPGGGDFLSPALVEADLMRRVRGGDFAGWLRRFLPDLAAREPGSLFTPATVSDSSDPQIVHLHGLNLSRAWCMRDIAAALPDGDPMRAALLDAAAQHSAAALPNVTGGDYMGQHWLASFAVYALT